MAKIVINKNFQSKYLYRAYERLVKPDYSINTCLLSVWDGSNKNLYLMDYTMRASVSYYKDLSSVYKTTWVGFGTDYDGAYYPSDTLQKVPHQYFLCDESFITLLNKINKLIKSGMSTLPKIVNSTGNVVVTAENKTANVNIFMLYASLFSADKNVRNNTIDYFYLSNIITIDEANTIKNVLSTFNTIDPNVTIDGYGGRFVPKVENIDTILKNSGIDINILKSLRLDNPYKQVTDNVNNNQLYLLVIPYVDSKFIDGNKGKILRYDGGGDLNILTSDGKTNNHSIELPTGKCLVGYNTFHRKDTNTVVNQIPYIALSITEVGQGGDIEYDHLDEIEYLDELKISIALPKEYV